MISSLLFSIGLVILIIFLCIFFCCWVDYHKDKQQKQIMDYKEIINLSKSNEHKWSFVNSYFPIGTAYAIYKSSGMGLYIEIHTKTYLQGFILNRYVRKQKKIKIKNELKYQKENLISLWEKDIQQYNGKDKIEIEKIFNNIKNQGEHYDLD